MEVVRANGLEIAYERAGEGLVVIPRSGHVSNLEQPDEVNHAVRQFCRAHSPRRT